MTAKTPKRQNKKGTTVLVVPCVSGIRENLPLNIAEHTSLSEYPYRTDLGSANIKLLLNFLL